MLVFLSDGAPPPNVVGPKVVYPSTPLSRRACIIVIDEFMIYVV